MSAIISECKKYRYRLDRDVASSGKVIAFFGINPSYADGAKDDNTIIRMRGFTLRHGGSRFIVGNVFSYRTPYVRNLATAEDCFGNFHSKYLQEIIFEADLLVPCWGSRNKLPKSLHSHIDSTMIMLINSGKPVYSFGLTATSDPKHPLMLAKSTPLVPWEIKN